MDTSVVLENARLKGNWLSFKGASSGDALGITLFIFDIKEGAIPENKSFTVNPDDRISSSSTIHVHYFWKDPESGKIESDSIQSGYTLTVQFGKTCF